MRFLPLEDRDRAGMLESIGVDSIGDLFADVPAGAMLSGPVDMPSGADELTVERHIRALARQNLPADTAPFFIGAGAYRHHVPAVVDHLIQRSEFLTAYTPYQPEISQGTLQYLFEFQTQVCLLTGMDAANASMYDGSTACAEAVLMAGRITKRSRVVLSGGLHPQYRDVVQTMVSHIDHEIEAASAAAAWRDEEDLTGHIDDDTGCVVVQNPDFFGNIHDLAPVAEAAHAAGALLIVVVTEPVSFGAIRSPGDMGADIVVGEGQGIGNSLSFGGPYLGLFATRQQYVRQMPGRLCGETVDADGKRGFVLTLSTREQHIRREKATSNICTNSGLCALAFCIHLALLGDTGLKRLARINHGKALALHDRLSAIPGVTCRNDTFFNEFCLKLDAAAGPVVDALVERGILGGLPVSRLAPEDRELENLLLVCATETVTPDDVEEFASALAEVLGQ